VQPSWSEGRVSESSFDPGERLQAPGSLWFLYSVYTCTVTVNVTIDNYKRNKDTKRKNKRNQFMIVSSLSYNQNDNQYAQGK
jgi:hypothetical protein